MQEHYRPGLEDVIAAETQISHLDVEREEIIVRGYSLLELIRAASYVDVVGLLIDGHLPDAQRRQHLEQELVQAPVPQAIYEIVAALPPTMHAMDRLRTAISALAGFDPEATTADPEREQAKAPRLIGQIAQIVANLMNLASAKPPAPFESGRPFAENFLRVMVGREVTAKEVRAFEQALIAYSEHELPNSTFAARVVASTLSDVYGALTAAVASLKGPLHGGATEAVIAMLQEAQTPEGLEGLIRARLARKERIMGFGHRVYMRRTDPRAQLLKEILRDLGSELLPLCERGEAVMRTEKGLYPNLDYYAAPLYSTLGIPQQLYTPIFFAARSAGLLAHIIEQHRENRLYRPRARYIGPRGLTL